jgi:hypothetical protein
MAPDTAVCRDLALQGLYAITCIKRILQSWLRIRLFVETLPCKVSTQSLVRRLLVPPTFVKRQHLWNQGFRFVVVDDVGG